MFASKKTVIAFSAFLLIVLIILGLVYIVNVSSFAKPPIKVGVLHSFTGTMAMSETSVTDAT